MSANKGFQHDQLIHDAREIIGALETLQSDNEIKNSDLLAEMEQELGNNEYVMQQIDNDRDSMYEKNYDTVTVPIEETKLMVQLSKVWQSFEGENAKLKAISKLATRELAWSKEELQKSCNEITNFSKKINKLENEIKNYKHQETLYPSNTYASEKTQQTSIKPTTDSSPENSCVSNFDYNNDDDFMGSTTSNSNTAKNKTRLKTLMRLISQYAKEGRYDVAVPLIKQTIEDSKKKCGATHPDVASLLNVLGLMSRDRGMYETALQYMNEALEIKTACFGKNHNILSSTYNNISVLYVKVGKLDEAVSCCQKALFIRKNELGPDHPDMAKQLSNLALIYQKMEKYEKAMELYKQGIEIIKKNDSNHNYADKLYIHMAFTSLKMEDYEKSEKIYMSILPTLYYREYNHEPHDFTVIDYIRALIKKEGNSSTNVELYDNIGNWHTRSKNMTTDYAQIFKNLTYIYYKQNRTKLCEEMKKELEKYGVSVIVKSQPENLHLHGQTPK
ncbi:hypothetical protein A3Q56_01966 [Intoshia linei]|uniref:Kinesin light chain n=1 Tax=Intoshia linei TaxID=1819745 RepID=A0A177B7Q7_9BILA|nr:hypothetical protein A3Q56_01966 [Intoshia linei]